MNTTSNTYIQPVKKLTLNKETIRSLIATEVTNREPGTSANCTMVGC